MHTYRAPRWLLGDGAFGGNLQTIWPVFFSRRHEGPVPAMARERWATPDGDFIDVDWQRVAPVPAGTIAVDAGAAATTAGATAAATDVRPLLVLFHGLEGSSASHYAQSFAAHARAVGWDFALPHFRGCSGEMNLAPRAYHSGDFEEIGWVLGRLRLAHRGPIVAVGVSLGGNALLRWAEEAGDMAARTVQAVAAVSSPVDLAAGGHAIGRGFNRAVYGRMFLRSMKPKALAKWAQHPGLFDRERLLAARDLHDFDDAFTAPVHGFRNADDYWARASAKPRLRELRVPTLVLNARNDPFVPAASLPRPHEVSPSVTLWQPAHGGHVGFAGGPLPGHLATLPERVVDWLRQHLPQGERNG